jgi:hypothetical protein
LLPTIPWGLIVVRRGRSAEGRDNIDDTIVGSNGFVRRLKQQSTNEGGTRGEMVMKWVKKEEERTTIEGRGHDEITIK